MKRRSLLKLGIGAGVVLAVAGGGLALLKPGLVADKLSPDARQLMRAVALAVFDGLLPADAGARDTLLNSHLDRLDANIAGFPPHLRGELSQVLALLTSSGGRLALTGLGSSWATASTDDVKETLQAMSVSGIGMKQQIYHALRDLNSLVFFSNAASWQLVGYPGPREIP